MVAVQQLVVQVVDNLEETLQLVLQETPLLQLQHKVILEVQEEIQQLVQEVVVELLVQDQDHLVRMLVVLVELEQHHVLQQVQLQEPEVVEDQVELHLLQVELVVVEMDLMDPILQMLEQLILVVAVVEVLIFHQVQIQVETVVQELY